MSKKRFGLPGFWGILVLTFLVILALSIPFGPEETTPKGHEYSTVQFFEEVALYGCGSEHGWVQNISDETMHVLIVPVHQPMGNHIVMHISPRRGFGVGVTSYYSYTVVTKSGVPIFKFSGQCPGSIPPTLLLAEKLD